MLHRMIEGIQKNKYKIFLIVILIGISFAGYRFFIGDKLEEMKELKADLDLGIQSKELADYKISKIPEYHNKIEDLNKDIEKLKATFPSEITQENITAKIAGYREYSDTLMNCKFTGIQIISMVDYYNSIENPYGLKGYVIEYNVELDFTGEFKQIYELLGRLQSDSSVRVNSISVYTNEKRKLLNCNMDIAYVGLTDSSDIEDLKDKLQYPGERENIFD